MNSTLSRYLLSFLGVFYVLCFANLTHAEVPIEVNLQKVFGSFSCKILNPRGYKECRLDSDLSKKFTIDSGEYFDNKILNIHFENGMSSSDFTVTLDKAIDILFTSIDLKGWPETEGKPYCFDSNGSIRPMETLPNPLMSRTFVSDQSHIQLSAYVGISLNGIKIVRCVIA